MTLAPFPETGAPTPLSSLPTSCRENGVPPPGCSSALQAWRYPVWGEGGPPLAWGPPRGRAHLNGPR